MATIKHMGTPFYLWGECEPVAEPLEKAGVDGVVEPQKWILKGFASCEIEDADGQIVDQDGIDWSIFDSRGLVTSGHPYRQEAVVGVKTLRTPRLVDGTTKGNWIEVELNPELPMAPALWNSHRALCKGPSGRGLGFSVEGWAKEIKGKRITKSIVSTVAIDLLPKNPMTYAMPIAASLGAYLGAGGSTDVNFPALMKALALASDPDVRAKLELIDGQSIAHLAALRIASRYPDRTFAEALALAKSIPGVSL